MAELVKRCGCPDSTIAAKWQSKEYGEGMRLFTTSGKKDEVMRCTVCGNGGSGVKKK